MRVAWTPRRQDRDTGEWVDGNTSYATVLCWRKLATHAALSLRKGDPVMVRGRLSIRPYEDKEGNRRIAVEVEATSVGHDLSRGVAFFQRIRPSTGLTAAQHAAVSREGAVAGAASGAAGGAHAEGEADARRPDGQLSEVVTVSSAADLDDLYLGDSRFGEDEREGAAPEAEHDGESLAESVATPF